MLSESPACDTQSRYSARRSLHHADFFCHAPKAHRVSIMGDFNNWNPHANPMIRQLDGHWKANLELRHGYYRYAFLVDGKFVLDPNATGRTRGPHNQPVSLIAIS